MNELNGLAIVGSGSVNLVNSDGSFTPYLLSVFNFMDYAKLLNDEQDYFPVFGLGRGHQAVHLYETKDSTILTTSHANGPEIPNFLSAQS
jgi:hypothetical protein